MSDRTPVRRALVSVYDKSGLPDLARALDEAGVEIVSTGSTAGHITAAGIPVTQVSSVTGFPECLGGRVKTLHPGVHAGLLADVSAPEHVSALADLGIAPFELLIVNLYPFTETVASGADAAECIEQIDIGGPAMIRAAAKNHRCVAVAVEPFDYDAVVQAVADGGFTLDQRRDLAAKAFAHTATYDIAVASWLGNVVAPDASGFPQWLGGSWERSELLRYGENPHQNAALYVGGGGGGLAAAEQHQGKQMSYNNYVDSDAALRAAFDQTEPCVAIIKHANPCGIAIANDVAEAYGLALETDPLSAFGSVVATNGTVTREMAVAMADVFTEVLVAPDIDPAALEVLAEKKNLRVLTVAHDFTEPRAEYRPITGGVLLQQADLVNAPGDDADSWRLVSGEQADSAVLRDLLFAWRACRSVKSNAIMLARDGAAVGVGMGQVNRVDSARLAVARAGADRANGAVAASDAFFPFPDGLQILIDAGVRAVVQPGGSVRDDDVTAAARAAGITMYLTGTRHFWH
ncbi:MAG: bifunctional phosphoribosylaminoimidazolecarboxamide formyltransferase/IMP cyclohydrolase [Candidatus Nanopelagicales bacterium]|nr:bifunctional phosphoribosylaminoimidazolecarboxamide formyltransferase/IMP cyclohydrolase [Candidatus Nanopelagicales bacterium]MDZ4248608.1 bifunctional phosphoribosylaminoimidazolecarboxamide formyltransferase/IMP cyclohydrolase [Candidatus Nanopelagicales bacterium]